MHYDADSAASSSEASTDRRRRISVARESCSLACSASSGPLDQPFVRRYGLAGVNRDIPSSNAYPADGEQPGLARPSAFLAHLEARFEPVRQFVLAFLLSDEALTLEPRTDAGPRLAHPCVRACDVSSALRDANGDVDLLAPQLAVLALCAMAMGSLLSVDPAILANHAGNVQTLADVESLGPDLRTLGQSRSNAYLALKSEAKRRARALGVDVDPSFANAASCWLLDYLEAVEGAFAVSFSSKRYALTFFALATDRHTPRPWHAAYLSHIRRLRWTQPLNSASWSDDTIWAFNLVRRAARGIGPRRRRR